MARALGELGVRRAFVVHGDDGLDEISISGDTYVAELRDGAVRSFTVTPADFGLRRRASRRDSRRRRRSKTPRSFTKFSADRCFIANMARTAKSCLPMRQRRWSQRAARRISSKACVLRPIQSIRVRRANSLDAFVAFSQMESSPCFLVVPTGSALAAAFARPQSASVGSRCSENSRAAENRRPVSTDSGWNCTPSTLQLAVA